MSAPLSDELIAFAARLADVGGEAVRRRFRARIPVEAKADATPVTAADREAEAAMRALIEREHPGCGVVGEEYGADRPDAAETWVLDPIDGTKAFIAGKPVFGVLAALLRDGRPVLGVIDQPVLGERWVGASGRETTFNGAPARTRRCPTLGAALLNATTPDMFAGADRRAFDRLARRAGHTLYGGDGYAYGLLASGHIDLAVEAGLALYDYCALAPVVEGAGGAITDWRGDPLHAGSDGRVAAAGDPELHAEALAVLAGRARAPEARKPRPRPPAGG